MGERGRIVVTSRAGAEIAPLGAVIERLGAPLGLMVETLLLPAGRERLAAAVAGGCGVIVAGGSGYGSHDPRPLSEIDPERYRSERLLIGLSRTAELPILGLCRGMQVLNEDCGGTTRVELPDDSLSLHLQPDRKDVGVHRLRIRPGTWLAQHLPDGARVNSFHRQAVAELGAGLIAAAVADDGVIEAFENSRGRPLLLGLQYHPEHLDGAHDELLAQFLRETRGA